MIKEICDVIDASDKVFILVMIGIILFLVGATLVANRWAKKHGCRKGGGRWTGVVWIALYITLGH